MSNKMAVENGQRSLETFMKKINLEKQMYKIKYDNYKQKNEILCQVSI